MHSEAFQATTLSLTVMYLDDKLVKIAQLREESKAIHRALPRFYCIYFLFFNKYVKKKKKNT